MNSGPSPSSERQIRIAMCGTFDVKNLGDMLFPIVLRHELGRRIPKLEVQCFSYYSKQAADWPYAVTPIAQLPELVASFDGLVIGGGHLVRFDKAVAPGYFPPAADLHHPTSYWLLPAMLGIESNVPVIWSGVGASANPPDWGRDLMRKAIQASAYVSVRDTESRYLFQKIAEEHEIRKVPDTVFGIRNVFLKARPAWHDQKPARPYVVIQANPRLRPDARPIRKLADWLKRANYEIKLLAVAPALDDDPDVMRDIVGPEAAAVSWEDPLDVAGIIANASGVVGLSLHMSIVALAFGVPILRPARESLSKYHALDGLPDIFSLERYAIQPTHFQDAIRNSGQRTSAMKVYEAELKYHWDQIASIVTTPSERRPPANLSALKQLPFLLEGETLQRASFKRDLI